ncbi:MAG: hypothetical protein ACRC68_07395 [Clostridium sp.]
MNKYFSKALFYDETRKCIGTFTLTSVILIIKIIEFFTFKSIDTNKYASFDDAVVFTSFFIACGIMANLYESYNNKEAKYGFMLTQPYKRDAIVFTKFITTILSFIIPLLIYGIISTVILMGNSSLDLVKELWSTILVSISCASLITATIQLSNKFIGVTVIATFMPIVAVVIFPVLMVVLLGLTPIYVYSEEITSFLKPIIENLVRLLPVDTMSQADVMIIFSVIIIALTIIVLGLSIILNRKIAYEKTTDLFLFKSVEVFFTYLVSLFLAVIIVIFITGLGNKMGIKIDKNNLFTVCIMDITIITLTIALKKTLYFFKRRAA